MVELLQNTSNFKKVQDKETQFLLIYLFLFLKLPLFSLKNIIFDNIFLYSAYVDDTTFFLSDEDSVIEAINVFHKFLLVSGLKPTEAKREIGAISVLKGVSVALCSMDCIDLTKKR